VPSEHLLFAKIKKTRTGIAYGGQTHLILVGCFCHSSDGTLDACPRHAIAFHLVPAHSSDQTQRLDVGVVRFPKSEAGRLHLPENLNPKTVRIVKILAGLHKAATRDNVIRAARWGGV
jgi:hypothetical protein